MPSIFRDVVTRFRAVFIGSPLVFALVLLAACDDSPVVPPADSNVLSVLGNGPVLERYTGEVFVRGNIAYTTTWGFRSARGNAVKIWDLSGGGAPVLVDSL